MNTHDLVAFVAVVETGSIVAASARLNLTQPGVTRRIQNLEEMLGAASGSAVKAVETDGSGP